MDDLKLEQDLTESQDDLETVVIDSESTSVDGVDPEPRVPRRRFPRLIKRFGLAVLLVLVIGIAATFFGIPIAVLEIFDFELDRWVEFLVIGGISLVLTALLIFVALKSYACYTRKFETRVLSEISLRGQILPILVGLVVGVLLAGTLYLIQWALGIVEITFDEFALSWTGVIIIIFWLGFGTGIVEELLFRVFLLRHIQVFLGSYAAIVLSSILFGFVHLLDPGHTWYTALMLGIGLGTLLGTVYLATNNLWMAATLHGSYNITVSLLVNATVTEFSTEDVLLYRYVAIMVLALIAAVPFLIYAIRKGHIVRPRLLTYSRR